MKPVQFDIVRPSTVPEAVRLMRESDGTARPVAGAQSLGPMLNLRLAQPRLLIDLTGIPELTRITDQGDALTIGACVTSANIEDGRLPGRGLNHLASVARRIAYRAVRNRSTIGGSICHADPAADWISVMCALDAQCHIAGASRNRQMPMDQFVTGAYETAIADDEILEAVTLRRLSPRARFGFVKICRKAGEFAMAMSAVLNEPDTGNIRIAIGATKGRPIVIADGRDLFSDTGAVDEAAVLKIFDRHNITEHSARRQQLAALIRAFDQATAP